MSQFAPLSLAPAFTHQQQPALDCAYNGTGFNNAPFATNNVFSIDNSFPSYFSPGSPLEHLPSPASSAGELFQHGSERESSPASSFLPTPVGSPKMVHHDLQINNIGQQQQWSQFDFATDLSASLGGKPAALPAQHQFNMAPQFQPQYQPQQVYNQNMMYAQQPQYYQQQPMQSIQQSTFYLPNNQLVAQQQQPYGMPIAAPQPQPQFAPSYETPQGTYFFVPSSIMPVTSAMGMPSMMAHSPPMSVGSTESWDQLASIPLPPLDSAIGQEETKPVVMASAPAAKKSAPKKKKNTTKRFVCPHPGCDRAFARNFNLGSHVKSHLGIRDFNCPECPKKFSRRHDRARHCAAVHDLHNIVEEQDVDECEA